VDKYGSLGTTGPSNELIYAKENTIDHRRLGRERSQIATPNLVHGNRILQKLDLDNASIRWAAK
jgi:hypothetical protein